MERRRRNNYIDWSLFRTFHCVVFCLLLPGITWSQYKNDYKPIGKTSAIPPEFIRDPAALSKKQIEENTLLTHKEAKEYFARLYYYIENLFKEGHVYLPNELTTLVESVKDRLLAQEPKLKESIKIYLTRNTSSNAFCFADGTIFVNVGLLAILDSEDELAFIMSHEIAHYAEQHNIRDFNRRNSIKNEQTVDANRNSDNYLHLRFSRESEFEADNWGLQLLNQAGYNSKRGIRALEKLKTKVYSDSIISLTFFDNTIFKTDSNWITPRGVLKAERNFREERPTSYTYSKVDDLFRTHPDLDKRIEAVGLSCANLLPSRATPLNTDTAHFAKIKLLARFERAENNYFDQDYFNAAISSLKLLKEFPENDYLQVAVARALYWLSYYKELKEKELDMMSDTDQNPSDVYKFYSLINEMPLKEAKKLSYAWTKSVFEKNPNSERLLFYFALNVESFLGKSAARDYYKEYASKFPNGEFISFINTKL